MMTIEIFLAGIILKTEVGYSVDHGNAKPISIGPKHLLRKHWLRLIFPSCLIRGECLHRNQLPRLSYVRREAVPPDPKTSSEGRRISPDQPQRGGALSDKETTGIVVTIRGLFWVVIG